jgi:hypothetical protein
MDALRTLEILITARTPFIAIETLEEDRAELTTEHILEEIKATRPLSVTRAEDIDALREWAKGRTVPAA